MHINYHFQSIIVFVKFAYSCKLIWKQINSWSADLIINFKLWIHSEYILTHKFKHKVDVFIIFSLNDIMQPDDIWMISKFLQEHNLPKSSLSICLIAKCIKNLFQCNNFSGLLVNCLPHYTICLYTTKITTVVNKCQISCTNFGKRSL